MKIVQLDSFAANPGDISWEAWADIKVHNGHSDDIGCDCTSSDDNVVDFVRYDRTAAEETVARAIDAEMVLTNKVVISDEVMERLPKLKYVGVLATGYNVVDVEAATRRGIVVTNIPAYSTTSVAQMVFAHLLNITNRVQLHSDAVSNGEWQSAPDFTFWKTPQIELANLTMGIFGLGNTGMATARIALAMGMKVMAYTSKTEQQLQELLAGATSQPSFIRKAESKEQFFSEADVVSLHCPLTPDTKHIINADTLAMMKPSAIVINTGRGPLIDEQALADALSQNKIYAAGVDVLTEEPPREGSPLIGLPNCFITPHIAWATRAARQRLLTIALENIKAFLAGKPVNQVR